MNGPSLFATGEFPGRYVVDRELGAGATSNVYLARDNERGGLVAIKVLRRELAESLSVDRFLREIRLMARLEHPRIVPILDSGRIENRPYCILPYMDGGTLRARLDRQRQLPLDEALAIGIAIAGALEFAHSQNVIHRDVKPENILFMSGEASLADFGIAKALEGAANDVSTSTGIVRGTPAYMSPEQAAGDRGYDGRTDIYSLGCVIYEMIAGVPPFVGATAQSVLSQRLTRMPQPVRVYRPQTPLALQRTIERAVATNPADRYQTAAGLAAALGLVRTQIADGTADAALETAPKASRSRRVLWVAGSAGGLALIAYAGLSQRTRRFFQPPPPDSTQVAVFVLDSGPRSRTATLSDDLLRSALRRWQELKVVPLAETVDAIARRHATALSSPDTWRAIAADLHAGRYVVARVSAAPTGPVISAEYRDVVAGPLHTAELPLPTDSMRVARTYRDLADSLVLRGASDEGSAESSDRPRHLFATQDFIRGLEARNAWNLAKADSLFARATALDPGLARAHLWLAQVRLWRNAPNDRWASSAERAAGDSSALAPSERYIAGALIALLHADYRRACERYRSIVAADERSFTGWYGLGDCAERDHVVVRDDVSPSGWRFRSSYFSAITAYSRAFELLPATYHGFEAGGYSRLRELLYTSTRALRRGVSADSSHKDFLARARLLGDTIAMIPFEPAQVLGGDPRAVVSPGAVEFLRAIFQKIAARWTAAFPLSPEAKEAIAISLELRGDPAALDSIRAAQRLATDAVQRLRFGAASVMLRVKFGIPDKIGDLMAARISADSLLQAYPAPTRDEAAILAPLAALTGHCVVARALLRQWAQPMTVLRAQIPQDITADAYGLRSDVAIGCPSANGAASAAAISARIDAVVSAPETRPAVEYYLLGGAVRVDDSSDSAMIARISAMGDNVLVAAADAAKGDVAGARANLDRRVRSRRNSMLGDFTPDAALPEALLFLRLRDTTAAIRILESTLASARAYAPLSPEGAPNNVALAGSLANTIALRAQLTASDPAAAHRWGQAALALWSGADPSLQPRLRALADSGRP